MTNYFKYKKNDTKKLITIKLQGSVGTLKQGVIRD